MRKNLCLIVFICASPAAHAQWNLNPAVRNAICTADSQQQRAVICADGSGGAIVSWDDHRVDSLHNFIYAQRINRYGYVQWRGNGIIVTRGGSAGWELDPVIAPDGMGGAVIGWRDTAGGNQLFAERLDSTGSVLWPSKVTIAVSRAKTNMTSSFVAIIGDGQGGAWFVWQQQMFSPFYDSVYVMHLDGNGLPLVPRTLVLHTNSLFTGIEAVSDSAGGIVIAYVSISSQTGNPVLYLQRLDANANGLWGASGKSLTNNNVIVQDIYLISNRLHGAIVGWNQDSALVKDSSFIASADANGTIIWAVSSDAPVMDALAEDGYGGALAILKFPRYGDTMYLRRINSSGSNLWTSTSYGVLLSDPVQTSFMSFPAICNDGAGGAFAAWSDGGTNLNATHVDSTGNLFWGAAGKHVCIAPKSKSDLTIIPGMANEMIAVWEDGRNYSKTLWDIYAAKLGDPDLALTEQLLDFGRVNVGDTAQIAKPGLMYNNGVEPLGIARMNLIGAGAARFAIVNDTTNDTLAYGQARNGVYSYSPAAVGIDTADVIFTSNTRFPSPVYRLRGRGVLPAINVERIINFGNVRVNQFRDSIVANVIRDTGGGYLRIDSIRIVGGGGQFVVDSGDIAPVILDSGKALTLKIRCTPSAAQAITAYLKVYGNIPVPGTALLTAKGVKGALRIAANAIDFGPKTVNIPADTAIADFLRDTGSAAVNIIASYLTGGDSDQFSVTGGGAPLQIAPTKGSQMSFEFLPTSAGEKQTTLVIITDIPDTSFVMLRGEGVMQQIKRAAILTLSQPQVIFPDTIVGATEDSTLVAWIENTGDTILTVTAMSMGGANAADFSVDDSAAAFSLDSGASHTIVVHFSPTSAGAESAQLQFASNSAAGRTLALQGTAHAAANGALYVAANTVDFGSVAVGSPQSVTKPNFIGNGGNAPLLVTGMALSGINASEFSILSAQTFALAAGATHDITLQFIPADTGIRTATLVVRDSLGDSANITLQGIGVRLRGILTVEAASIDMGSIPLGSHRDSIISPLVFNSGNDTVLITGVAFGGADASAFTAINSPFPLVLAPNATAMLGLRFTPSHTGVHSATLTFLTTAADTVIVALVGRGTRLINLSIGGAHGIPGATLGLPVTSDSSFNPTGVRQIAVTVQYDPDQFYPTGIAIANGAASTWLFSPLAASNGTATIAGTGTQPLANDSLLFVLQGEILASSVMNSPVFIAGASESGDSDVTLGVQGSGMIATDSNCGYNGTQFIAAKGGVIVENPSPNPANATTDIRYRLPHEGHLEISVYDANGKVLRLYANDLEAAGSYELRFGTSEYPAGEYFVGFSFDGIREIRRFVVRR